MNARGEFSRLRGRIFVKYSTIIYIQLTLGCNWGVKMESESQKPHIMKGMVLP